MTACPRKIAYHEAGHAVVASALGFDVIEIVKRADGWATGVAFPEEPTISEHFLLAAWSMAGGAAQDKAGYPADDGCIDDLNRAARSIDLWMGGDGNGPPDDTTEIDRGLLRANILACDLMAARWSLVEKIAKLIQDLGEIGEQELAMLLGVAP